MIITVHFNKTLCSEAAPILNFLVYTHLLKENNL